MGKIRLIKIIVIVMLISLQGCYAGLEPGYDGQSGGGSYEPLPIGLDGPPNVIVLPDTDDVYVVPDISVDLFFWNGWWWRPWEGRWYRSQYYNRDWNYYNDIPSFYFDVDPGWRGYYRDHDWHGYRWDYERIPNQQLQQSWKNWQNDRHWERDRTWDVRNYQPRPQQQRQELRQQRQREYPPNRYQIEPPQAPGQQPQKPQEQRPQKEVQENEQQPQHSPPQERLKRGEEEKRR